MRRLLKHTAANADTAKESVKSVRKSPMSTKKAKRKRAATPVAAVVAGCPCGAPRSRTIALASNCNVKDAGGAEAVAVLTTSLTARR